MNTISLAEVQQQVAALAARLNAPLDFLPTYDYSRDFGYPHIEIDRWGRLHYIVMEKGQELQHRITGELDELLYWIFANVTFEMATQYELENRKEDQDCRRMMFARQEELPGMLNDSWREREQQAHGHILQQHPFDDLAGLRASYCAELRAQGYTEAEINAMAYTRYPAS